MRQHIHLLIIDPQNDFCDLPPAHLALNPLTGRAHAPALPVPGAHADMQRLAGLIRAGGAGLGDITVTLDSHHHLDIAHPTFWRRRDAGALASVAPFTPISAQQVRDGEFQPRDPGALPRALAYLDALEARGRYTLMVWPVHCEIGSWGTTSTPTFAPPATNGKRTTCASFRWSARARTPGPNTTAP